MPRFLKENADEELLTPFLRLDPRVDSDLSGGKTYGGNATHQ